MTQVCAWERSVPRLLGGAESVLAEDTTALTAAWQAGSFPRLADSGPHVPGDTPSPV